MGTSEIKWKAPWRAIQFAAEILGVQKQLDSEVTSKLPLDGKGAIVLVGATTTMMSSLCCPMELM